MGRNLQREYNQEAQICVIMPLLEGTNGVQKMSKSLGNYIGINESPQEMFGKTMSISDDLMWRYYELLTDATSDEIAAMRNAAVLGERNPRDLKVELAKSIITDFHSAAEAQRAEEEFNRVTRNKEVPEEIETKTITAGPQKLQRVLVAAELAGSMAEARRLIEQGGVRVDGERCTHIDYMVDLSKGQSVILQVGKRRFVKLEFW